MAPQFHPLPYMILVKFFFVLEIIIYYGEWQSTALFGSRPICLNSCWSVQYSKVLFGSAPIWWMNSGVGVK